MLGSTRADPLASIPTLRCRANQNMKVDPPAAAAIPRKAHLSRADFVTEHLRPNRPVIVTDALESWPALARWTPEFFREKSGTKEFTIDGQKLRLDDLIDRVLASSDENPAPYLRNQILREHFPELLSDIDPQLPYFHPNWMTRHYRDGLQKQLHRGSEIELYLGGQGGRFPLLHWDGIHTHAFLMQIYGCKQFFVFGPDQTPFMYPRADLPNASEITDVEHPDLARFPLFARATPTVFVLEPGEMLFIPSGWWHTTRMLSASISLSINTADSSNWPALTRDLTRGTRGLHGVKKLAYLKCVGLRNLAADFLHAGAN